MDWQVRPLEPSSPSLQRLHAKFGFFKLETKLEFWLPAHPLSQFETIAGEEVAVRTAFDLPCSC